MADESILSTMWDTAAGLFKQVSAIELERYEAKRLAELREDEQAGKIKRDETLAGTATRYISYADDPKLQNHALLIGAGMIGVAFLLLLKG